MTTEKTDKSLTKQYDDLLKQLKLYSILIAEDCTVTASLIENILKPYFGAVYVCTDGAVAKSIFNTCSIDIILTDIHMPFCDGIDLIKFVRTHDKNIPIIVMTAEDDTDSLKKLIPLKLSDYILKPIEQTQLLFRIVNSLQELMHLTRQTIYIHDGIIYDRKTNKITKGADRIVLTKREMQLLNHLCEQTGSYTPAYEIIAEIWGDEDVSNSTLRGLIRTLRKKLGEDAVVAVSNLGYMLRLDK